MFDAYCSYPEEENDAEDQEEEEEEEEQEEVVPREAGDGASDHSSGEDEIQPAQEVREGKSCKLYLLMEE